MNVMRWMLAALVLAAPAPAQRQVSGGELGEGRACYDVESYHLRLKVDPDERSIRGTLGMKARVVAVAKAIRMDLDKGLKVRAVRLDGKKVRFTHEKHRIRIPLGGKRPVDSTLDIEVDYGGKPRVAPRPPWQGGFTWSTTKEGKPWIATSCQGEGADLWWPCKDHPSDKPSSMKLDITVPKGLVCASNGVLVGEEDSEDGRWTTFKWEIKNPISNYCVAINIAPYVRLDAELESVAGGTFPVHFYVLPENVEPGKKMLVQILDHLKFFEDVCGPYPFRNEKYGVVETPHLGMEHQTIIAYGNRFRGLRSGYDWLHHHELAHEWWGNLVTNKDWKDMWIHEGFGTYMQALYLERLRGEKGYRREMASKRFMSNRKALAPRETTDSHEIYFAGGGNDIYNKGSWVLHTLRWTIGDEAFFKAIRTMCYPDPEKEKVTDGSQCRFVDTDEFIGIVSDVTGADMTWFFDVYCRQPALPELEELRSGRELILRWKTPEKAPFEVPVPVKVGDEVHRVQMSQGTATLEIPRGADVVVDPDKRLLKKLNRKKRGRRKGRDLDESR